MRLHDFVCIGAVAARAASAATDDVLRFGPPESVGMDPKALEGMISNLTAFTEARNWGEPTDNRVLPIEPGGVTLVARHGVIVSHFAFGKRTLWAGVNGTRGVELPESEQEDAIVDTIYDAASLTKMYTTVAALRCIDKGLFTLNGTVATWLPEFGVNGKENITVLQLLTHTSGFPASPSPLLYLPTFPTYESRIDAILSHELHNDPGEVYVYSDLSYMSLMLLIEKVTEKPLDKAIGEITDQLGMKDTFFNKGNKEGGFERYERIAPTEFQRTVVGDLTPDRPQPCKTVHDEQAWSLNGVSGHAGLFTTVLDTAHLCEMIRRNGTYNGHRILSQESVDAIFTNWNARFGPGPGRGAGFELNQTSTAGPMASERTASHTGFTGTSMVIDRATETIFLHFANRVHPSREWSSNSIVRQTLGAWVAKSLGRDVLFPR